MQLNITGHHVEVTDSLKAYVAEKLERLEKHFDHVNNVHVILSVEKQRQKSEATVNINGATLFANCTQDDMYASIDSMTDKLDRQIKKHKEKLKDHHQNEGSQIKHQQPVIDEE